MGWVILLVMVLVTAALFWWFVRPPRAVVELSGAALLLGVAGYAWQGMPGYAGEPRQSAAETAEIDEEALAARDGMGEQFGPAFQFMVFADAANRAGRHQDAANYLRNGIKENPKNPDLWVALGNSLILHGDGIITPAAQFSFQRAAEIAPDHPAPPFFFGLALAQSGKIDQARAIWTELLERTPDDAEWRADLESRLAAINQMQPPMPADDEKTAENSDNEG